MCDVEQRLNTENINMATQSSKESFSALYCGYFNQLSHFLRAFNPAIAGLLALSPLKAKRRTNLGH